MSPDIKTDNLMLLLGTNPLPNYIAARMLAGPNTQLHFVITPEIARKPANGEPIHERLASLIGKNPKNENLYVRVKSADPGDIYDKVRERVEKTSGSWGLHYTGGKKSMSTHAYRAMEETLKNKREQGIFSYLDSDRMELIIDPSGTTIYEPIPIIEKISLYELLWLHGQPKEVLEKVCWEKSANTERISLSSKHPRQIPFEPGFCEALLDCYLGETTKTPMNDWRTHQLSFEPPRFLMQIYGNPASAQEQARWGLIFSARIDPSGEYRSPNNIKERAIPVYQREAWGQLEFPNALRTHAKCTYKSLRELSEKTGQPLGATGIWLGGRWLEDYVLAQLLAIKDDCLINDFALGLESNIFEPDNINEDTFESDIIAIRGHRLFYLSVTTDKSKGLNKSKLFEAYLRAQQLGGEHAEAGLVSFYEKPGKLEKELRDERHARVKAFGPDQMRSPETFQTALKEWFTQKRRMEE